MNLMNKKEGTKGLECHMEKMGYESSWAGVRSESWWGTYDHRTFTATMVVSYHRTSTAITVFYSELGGLSGRCFLKTAPHFGSVI